jgi:hypothetical protein
MNRERLARAGGVRYTCGWRAAMTQTQLELPLKVIVVSDYI